MVLPLHHPAHQRGPGHRPAHQPPLDYHRRHGPDRRSKGKGVVGKQPVLEPGESFEYTSGCELKTPFGSMRGTYQMVTANRESFDVEIPSFTMTEPYTTVH